VVQAAGDIVPSTLMQIEPIVGAATRPKHSTPHPAPSPDRTGHRW
jgi:hypothetical protein